MRDIRDIACAIGDLHLNYDDSNKIDLESFEKLITKLETMTKNHDNFEALMATFIHDFRHSPYLQSILNLVEANLSQEKKLLKQVVKEKIQKIYESPDHSTTRLLVEYIGQERLWTEIIEAELYQGDEEQQCNI